MPVRIVVFLTMVSVIFQTLKAQELNDTISEPLRDIPDTNIHQVLADTSNFTDSLSIRDAGSDSLVVSVKPKKSALDSEVHYTADDSIKVSLTGEKLYLYGNAQIVYQNIDLKAEYIELDYAREVVFAKGITDSLGIVTGSPVFKQGKESFESDSLAYNFNSENGIIYHIITEQGEGYLHSDKTKRHAGGHIHIQDGKYTTCDAKHPHFYLALRKGIVIPEDKIITGHAYIVVADIPIKVLGVPFGFFPNTTSRASGILLPTYGSEERRGFYLRNFGWYQVLGDYADLRILGDFYTKGTRSVRSNLTYKWRYHFSGGLAFNFAHQEIDDREDIPTSEQYGVVWRHTQDPKANPTSNFSANVNFTSNAYDRDNSTNTTARLTNTKSSSISYTKRWPGTPFNFSMSGNATQNETEKTTDLNLPTGSLNMSSIYPLRSKTGTGKYKWYENISLSYSSQFSNSLNDSTDVILKSETWEPDNLQNGFTHTIPLAMNFKLGKVFTISPSLSYRGMMYTKKIIRSVEVDSVTGSPEEVVDGIESGFSYLYSLSPNIGASFTPKMYAMYMSTRENSYIEAVRHVISPSVGAGYTPDVKNENLQRIFKPDYYQQLTYIDTLGRLDTLRNYSPWEDEKYGVPSSPGQSGSIRFALNNNIEMKIRPRNDTTGESKKVSILDNLNFSTSYNPFAEEFKWGDVSMVTGTRIFNNKLDIRLNGRFSPYGLDSVGNKSGEFYYNTNGKFLRFTNMTITSGFSLKSKAGNKTEKEQIEEDELLPEDPYQPELLLDDDLNTSLNQYSDAYVNFNIPWSLNFNYSWSVNKTRNKSIFNQTVEVRGDFSFTPKWKIGGRVGYDLEARDLTYTSINIYRDLHCWEMRFTVIPFGQYASYSFTIQAKGSLLSDLKYEREPNWYDQF